MPISRRTALGIAGLLLAVRAASAQRAAPAPVRTLTLAERAELLTPDEGVPERVHGAADAKVTIVEYALLSCPHCATFNREVLPLLRARYIEPGRVRLIVRYIPGRDLPVVGATTLAACAPEDRHAALVERLFARQERWFVDDTNAAAQELRAIWTETGLEERAFETCLRDPQTFQRLVAVARRAGERFRITSVPTLFIGDQQHGNLSFADIEAVLAPMLRG